MAATATVQVHKEDGCGKVLNDGTEVTYDSDFTVTSGQSITVKPKKNHGKTEIVVSFTVDSGSSDVTLTSGTFSITIPSGESRAITVCCKKVYEIFVG